MGPGPLVVAIAVIVAACVIYTPLKHILKFLLLRKIARGALTHVGEQAMAKQPQQIKLTPVTAQWKNEEAVREQASPLAPLGFIELGAFSVDKMPGVLVRMLFQQQTRVAAHIFEHPAAGTWTELATRYTDGSSDYLSNSPATGIEMPPWARSAKADRTTPTGQLYQRFLSERRASGMKPTMPADVVPEFENAYLSFILWKTNKGITPEEVAQVMVKWAEKKQAARAQ